MLATIIRYQFLNLRKEAKKIELKLEHHVKHSPSHIFGVSWQATKDYKDSLIESALAWTTGANQSEDGRLEDGDEVFEEAQTPNDTN